MAFAENDLVYLLDENGKKYWFRVAFGMLKVPALGTIDGSRLRDLDDGSVLSIAGKRFLVFRPTTVDLIESLDRGAQIITPKDAASIVLNCDIRSGKKVLEVGAGSGGLTTAMVSAVAPGGHVHTLELKDENAQRVMKNLKRTGLDAYWSYQIGDARAAEVNFEADALTMDMPDPENALDNLLPHLRNGGMICAYVPNCNQLESAVNAMRARGICGIFSIEIMQRGMEIHAGGVRPSFEMLGHTGYLTFGRKAGQ
jgi:tRNA (adenine57-N1/adenine58-N1)-methyltransferase